MMSRSGTLSVDHPRTHSGGPCLLFLLAVLFQPHTSFAFVTPDHQHHKGNLNVSIKQTSQSTLEPSDEDILKEIDRKHYNDAIKLCSYLASEAITSVGDKLHECDTTKAYHSPTNTVLSDEAINTLRTTAHSYFEKRRENNHGAWGMEKVELGELLVSTDDVGWKKELDDALTQNIYPLIRSGWPTHDALSLPNNTIVKKEYHQHPVLTVTSATVVAGCGFPSTQATLTTLERDAGLFVVHIDLGNDDQVANTAVMGALYLESLTAGCEVQSNPIVGPLKPGQMVVHRSIERTSAIVVPSDIQSLEQQNKKSSLDTSLRRQILKAAESTRHYALRLVVTTKIESNDETDISEAPSEERSYRLRTFSRLLSSRMRYLTLASELDPFSSEIHFWLGFDYLAKSSPDNQLGVHQQLSYIDKAVFHLEKAASLCPTDARVHFQLAATLKAKLEWEKRLLTEQADGDAESVYLTRVADALERSVQLGSAAVRVCATDTSDLSITLSTLAETRCKMGEFEEALNIIDKWAECGSLRSALAIEDRSHKLHSRIPSYKWIQTQGYEEDIHKSILNRRDVAVATVGDVRVFEPEDISLLRAAADKHFAQAAGKQTSRYTMQYEGNILYLFCPFFSK